MGKLSRKVSKQQQKNKAQEVQQQMEPLKKKMQEQMAAEEYAPAIETMAELAKLQCMDPEVMYRGAYAYFMLGDYDRAANWINNTLTYAPQHVPARILLARLCLLQDRTEDGLAIFDFVFEHYEAALTEQERVELEEILEYYGRNEADKLQRRYPHIAAFLTQAGGEILDAELVEAEPGEKPVVETAAAETTEAGPAAAAPAEDPLRKAQAAVAALKDLMAKASTQPEVQDIREKADAAAEQISTKAGQAVDKLKASVKAVVDAATEPAAVPLDAATTEKVKAEIMGKDVSMAEKIKLFNAFAGAAYVENRLADAHALLESALALDTHDAATLRNLVLLLAAEGKPDQAMGYAAKLPMTDFALLEHLRKH